MAKTLAADKDWEKQEQEWQAENDLRTLIDAEKIKRDPKRLKAAMAKRKEMKKDLDAIED